MEQLAQKMRVVVNEVFYDLQEASRDTGEELCAEGLADYLEDRMYDSSAEYRGMPDKDRSELALRVAREFV